MKGALRATLFWLRLRRAAARLQLTTALAAVQALHREFFDGPSVCSTNSGVTVGLGNGNGNGNGSHN